MNENETPKDEIQQDQIQNDAPPADSAENVSGDGAAPGESTLDVTQGINDESSDSAQTPPASDTPPAPSLETNALPPPPSEVVTGDTATAFPPEPDFTARGGENKPFPPAPKLRRDRRTVWANGREYGSIEAAAVALGVTTDIVHSRIASSDESFSTYRWGE